MSHVAESSPGRSLATTIWWLMLARGALAIVFGLVAIVAPVSTIAALLIIFGVFSIVDGIVAVAGGVATRGTSWGWVVFNGLLGIVIGIVALRYPETTLLAMVLVIAAWALVTGVFAIFGAIEGRREGGRAWGWTLVSGILSVLLGLLFTLDPVAGAGTLVLVTGVYAVLLGATWIGLALAVRREARALSA